MRTCAQVARQVAQQRRDARAHAVEHARCQALLLAKVDDGLGMRQARQHLAAPGLQPAAVRAARVLQRLRAPRLDRAIPYMLICAVRHEAPTLLLRALAVRAPLVLTC